ncbi:MAG TPA: hypothetical protein VFY29_04270 [Terriglobia bacterium]|nr:hypothetical protein [Terriglobia bacterium]
MNIPHIHILLNHVPTVGFSLGLALFVAALVTKSQDLKRASLAIVFFIAVLSTAVYVSGNAAADAICPVGQECLPGVAKTAISSHEDIALLAYALMQLTGAFAFIGLWRMRRTSHIGSGTTGAILVLSLLTFGMMARAATIGGEIRHPEIVEGPVEAAESAAGFQLAWFNPPAVKSFVLGSEWVWPASETLHFIGLCLLFSVVLMVDLRILGMAKGMPISAAHKILPWGLLGFGMNVITGMLFFIAAPEQYTGNVVFFWKVVLIVLAGINGLYFLVFDEAWTAGADGDAPLRSKVAALSAIVLWIGVLFCGHMLPFLGNAF